MLFPFLRFGYIVAPPDLVEAVRAARSITDRYGPSLPQAVLSDFIPEAHFERHLRRMRGDCSEHLEALVNTSRQRWGDRPIVRKTQTGLQTVACLDFGRSAHALARAAVDAGVEPVSRLPVFAALGRSR